MNLRTRVMIIGGIVGALVGVGAAYLYLQSAPVETDQEGRERLPSVQPGKAITASLGILTTIRQIVGLGQPS
jgi:preprotein translocase subunit YajC